MVDIKTWIGIYTAEVTKCFGNRVYFIGLQGSYGRAEATENSDIDMVVILNDLTTDDIGIFNTMLDTLPERGKICGFLSGKAELLRWDPSDLFQLYYDTTPVMGTLDGILNMIDGDAVDRAIKTGACNIYHACVHNMLYKRSDKILQSLYKSASFIIQALVFRQIHAYIRQQIELFHIVHGKDKEVLSVFNTVKNGAEIKFDAMSELLFYWAKELIIKEM